MIPRNYDRVSLQSGTHHRVAIVGVPPFMAPPEVIALGDRVFQRTPDREAILEGRVNAKPIDETTPMEPLAGRECSVYREVFHYVVLPHHVE